MDATLYDAKVKILQDNRSHQKRNAVRFRAATTQLDVAITFYLVASTTKDKDKSNGAIVNAEQPTRLQRLFSTAT